LKPRITVFGVGGAGGNAVNNMINAGLQGIDFVVANTDTQAPNIASGAGKESLGEIARSYGVLKLRPLTKEDVRTLKTLAREKTKTTVIARKLKRSVGAHGPKSNEIGCNAGRRP
jgi:cell division GTPase FtsZ